VAIGSQERVRILLEAAKDYAIFMLDPRGMIVTWNAGAERLKGYTEAEILGQHFSRFYSPEDIIRGAPEAQLRVAATTGRSETEGWRLRKNGSRFYADVVITAVHSASGVLLGFSKITRNINERRELQSQYENLLEAAPDALVISDVGGRVLLVNAQTERLFGHARAELMGRCVDILLPERMRGAHPRHRAFYTSEPRVRSMGHGGDLWGLRKDGTEFPVEISLSPMPTPQGLVILSAIRDITDRRESEQQLRRLLCELNRSNEELQQFAYVASHDLQEPLRMVTSYTQLLGQRYKGRLDADADEFIAYAVDGSARMQQLIQDLLIYSRIAATEMPPRLVSSERALEAALENLRLTMAENRAAVTHDLLPPVTADDMHLVQVFQNLIGNAIKYRGADDPRIHVSAARHGVTEWVFSVRDNGLGIDPQYFDRIFGLFQRLHGKQEFSGTGIGLSICKKILDRLGGRIWVESRPGEGSTFHFALPAGETA